MVSAIPSQNVDPLRMAQCVRLAPAAPGDRAGIFETALVIKNRHGACKLVLNRYFGLDHVITACHDERTKCEA